MSKSVIFAYGSETGMGASIIEEAYAVAAETITDFDLALPEELGKGDYFFGYRCSTKQVFFGTIFRYFLVSRI